jgi:hypothetical protein
MHPSGLLSANLATAAPLAKAVPGDAIESSRLAGTFTDVGLFATEI